MPRPAWIAQLHAGSSSEGRRLERPEGACKQWLRKLRRQPGGLRTPDILCAWQGVPRSACNCTRNCSATARMGPGAPGCRGRGAHPPETARRAR
jgi:hypothetical protein